MKKNRIILTCLFILICLITGISLNQATCSAATKIKVSSVSITNLPSNYSILLQDETFTAKANILPIKATNKSLSWSSSDPCVATVNSKGIVTAKAGGFCKISAITKDGSKKKVSFYVKVQTYVENLSNGSWSSDYGDFTAGLGFSPTGHYSLSDIDAGNPMHYGAYQIDTQKKTITFDGTKDGMAEIHETWSYSFPSTNKMLLTNGMSKLTYTRSAKTINKSDQCNSQGLLFSNKSKNSIMITGYIGTASTITIPSTISGKPVLSISGFSGNTNIKKVVMSNSVTEISSYTFKDCINLKEITMSSQLKSILEGAFLGCSSLNNITLPATLEVLESTIFSGCSSLSEITIPDKVTILFNHTFRDCSNLRILTLPKSIQRIEPDALAGCTDVTIYGYVDSCAWEFAKTNKFKFVGR
jgi:hypothetical protein